MCLFSFSMDLKIPRGVSFARQSSSAFPFASLSSPSFLRVSLCKQTSSSDYDLTARKEVREYAQQESK